MAQPYQDPLIQTLIDKFNDGGPDPLKDNWYFGRPPRNATNFSASMLPIAFISFASDAEVGNAGVAEDEHKLPILLTVMVDSSSDADSDIDSSASHGELMDYVMGKDSSGILRQDTILWQLRRYQALGTNLWVGLRENIKIGYRDTDEERAAGLRTHEADITAVLTNQQLKPGING